MRMNRWSIGLVSAATVAALGSPAAAAGVVVWEGQTWDVNGSGTAVVNTTTGDVELTRTGTGLLELHVNRVLDPGGGMSLSASDTPWVEFSYIDDGTSQQGFDLFVEHETHPENFRLQGGSLFTNCDGLGYSRYGSPAVEAFDFAIGCDTPGRAAVEHTVYVGQRADGTIDWRFDGEWFTSTFLKDRADSQTYTDRFAFNDVHLRWRSASSTATFTDFNYGTDHPGPVEEPADPVTKDDCKNGGFAQYGFGNQGQCVKFVQTGKDSR